jgi:hypothetical protein
VFDNSSPGRRTAWRIRGGGEWRGEAGRPMAEGVGSAQGKLCRVGEKQEKWFACVTSDIAGKYHDIFARESEKSAIKQLSYLHYENLQILGIATPHFSLWFRFQLPRSESAQKI